MFEIEIEINIQYEIQSQQYSSGCLHKLTVLQVAMFTNTKCKHPLEYHRFKYRLCILTQSRVVSQIQSEAGTILGKENL